MARKNSKFFSENENQQSVITIEISCRFHANMNINLVAVVKERRVEIAQTSIRMNFKKDI